MPFTLARASTGVESQYTNSSGTSLIPPVSDCLIGRSIEPTPYNPAAMKRDARIAAVRALASDPACCYVLLLLAADPGRKVPWHQLVPLTDRRGIRRATRLAILALLRSGIGLQVERSGRREVYSVDAQLAEIVRDVLLDGGA